MIKEEVKFGVFSDLHLDIMHDGEARLKEFLTAAERERVDFIIQLGDFCYPADALRCDCPPDKMPINLKYAMEIPTDIPKKRLLEQYNAFPKPHYHLLGNHEMDFCSKRRALQFYGMESGYYSFVVKSWKFIVLDACQYRTDEGEIRDYHYGDYFGTKELPYIDEPQLQWLERELHQSEMPVVIFSHQPLFGGGRAVKNAGQVLSILQNANQREKKVYLCLNGHIHIDRYLTEQGIGFYTINSMSNHWIGAEYARKRFSPEIERKYPNLQFTFPYEKALFTFITLNQKGMLSQGRGGAFVLPAPEEIGCEAPDITATIKSREILWD